MRRYEALLQNMGRSRYKIYDPQYPHFNTLMKIKDIMLYVCSLVSVLPVMVCSQSTYYLGGNVYLEGWGDIAVTSVKAYLYLDNTQSTSTSYMGGTCNYYFGNVQAGSHRLQIASNSTIPIDTVITVNHNAQCGSGSSTYNFTVRVGY